VSVIGVKMNEGMLSKPNCEAFLFSLFTIDAYLNDAFGTIT